MVLVSDGHVAAGVDHIVQPLVEQPRHLIHPPTQLQSPGLSLLQLIVVGVKAGSEGLHSKVESVEPGLVSIKPGIGSLQLVSQLTLGFIDIS